MDRFCLNIAGVTVAVTSVDPSLKFDVPGARALFLSDVTSHSDVTVSVSWMTSPPVPQGKRLFDSGLIWKLYEEGADYRFTFTSPVFGPIPYQEAICSSDFSTAEVRLRRDVFEVRGPPYPLGYPVDELLVLHFLSLGRGVEIHSSGVVTPDGQGHLFVGASGAGKTTMTRLWAGEPGVSILSDDRIVLRKQGQAIFMHGTPWHGEGAFAAAERAPLRRVFFLTHGARNELVPQSPAEAVARLFACSFPPFHSRAGLGFSLDLLGEAVGGASCAELRFVPDASVVALLNAR